MAKTSKKEEKKILLRLRSKAYEQLKKAATTNNRSVNGEIAFTIEEKYL